MQPSYKITFDNKFKMADEQVIGIMDRAFRSMGGDMVRILAGRNNSKTPKDKGALRASADIRKLGLGHYLVSMGEQTRGSNIEYASYQERGMRRDGSHRVKQYTTAGTGKGYFKHALDTVRKQMPKYFRGRIK